MKLGRWQEWKWNRSSFYSDRFFFDRQRVLIKIIITYFVTVFYINPLRGNFIYGFFFVNFYY